MADSHLHQPPEVDLMQCYKHYNLTRPLTQWERMALSTVLPNDLTSRSLTVSRLALEQVPKLSVESAPSLEITPSNREPWRTYWETWPHSLAPRQPSSI